MIKKDIYKIMKEKSVNDHYLNRYVNFIFGCKENNIDIKIYEKHHILPQGKSFWPEYKSFKLYPWNIAILTPRQHLIAHWILAKALGGNMWFALFMMCGGNQKTNKRDYKISSKLYEQARINLRGLTRSEEHCTAISNSHKGHTVYKDKKENKFWLHRDDLIIKELDLVGHTKNSSYDGKNLKGTVTCRNIITDETIKVSKKEFDNNEFLVGINKGKKSSTKDRVWLRSTDGSYTMIHEDKVDIYIENGYIKDCPSRGIENAYAKDTIWVTNESKNIRCKTEEEYLKYLSMGYRRGRKGFSQKKKRDIVTCPHCGKSGKNSSAMYKWHFDNCKRAD